MKTMKPDIKANITITRKTPVYSGYRPAHLIGNYMTTGVHEYIGAEQVECGETMEGFITFLSPEYYPHTLEPGMKIQFQEGRRITGYAVATEVYNNLLRK